MAKEVTWDDQFEIGVNSIDNAHRKLFSIVRRLIHLSRDENNGKWACAEGIKYFSRAGSVLYLILSCRRLCISYPS